MSTYTYTEEEEAPSIADRLHALNAKGYAENALAEVGVPYRRVRRDDSSLCCFPCEHCNEVSAEQALLSLPAEEAALFLDAAELLVASDKDYRW